MAYFLTRPDERPAGGRPPPLQTANASNLPAPFAYQGAKSEAPISPLSRLVQDGYQAPNQGGFNAGVAQQWNSNVKENLAAYQQCNDPNYVKKSYKPNGYRVTNAPGGNSSLSLGWDEPAGTSDQPGSYARAPSREAALGCDSSAPYRAPSPGRAPYRAPSPGQMAVGRSGSRNSSREPGFSSGSALPQPRASSRGRAASPGGLYGGAANQFDRGNFPPPAPRQGGLNHGAARQGEATSLAFGARADNCSSNAFANGANQNCGNGITDRRTTRVLAPPGGRSQISFG